jgi:hypothetical protein
MLIQMEQPMIHFWQQPNFANITGHLYIPPANKIKPKIGEFALIGWQANPFSSDGLLVPATWDAGLKTGFIPTGADTEMAYRPLTNSSTAQAQGGTVGVYLNSADLIHGSKESKMMITPQINFATVRPFSAHGAVLVSLNLQVPTAVDSMNANSDTYVDLDLLWTDPANPAIRISYGTALFHHGARQGNPSGNIRIDPGTGNVMVNCPLLAGSPYATVITGSEEIAPWLHMKPFAYRISKAQFAVALKAIQALGHTLSLDPAAYELTEFHLNAELHYGSAPSSLGWSMSNATIGFG